MRYPFTAPGLPQPVQVTDLSPHHHQQKPTPFVPQIFTTMNATTQTLLPIGCIFDGAHGDDFNGLRVQKLAADYGWEGQQEDDNSFEFNDAIEEAVEYLQDFAPECHYVGFENGGDFGVWPVDADFEF